MKRKRTPVGRPPDGEEARACWIQIRVTAEEKELLERGAGKASVSSWMRDRCLMLARSITRGSS